MLLLAYICTAHVLLSLNHIRIEIHESNFRNLVMVGFADENKTVTITYQIPFNFVYSQNSEWKIANYH